MSRYLKSFCQTIENETTTRLNWRLSQPRQYFLSSLKCDYSEEPMPIFYSLLNTTEVLISNLNHNFTPVCLFTLLRELSYRSAYIGALHEFRFVLQNFTENGNSITHVKPIKSSFFK